MPIQILLVLKGQSRACHLNDDNLAFCTASQWHNRICLFNYFQEEEERKRKEEQERKEHEEYLLLKEHFTVEEEGVGETAEEVSDYTMLIARETWKYCCVLVVSSEMETTSFAVLLSVRLNKFSLVFNTFYVKKNMWEREGSMSTH